MLASLKFEGLTWLILSVFIPQINLDRLLDGMIILEAIYDATTPQWLRAIPAVEILRIAWVHQYWIDNGQLQWRSHKDLPPAGIRSNFPYDLKARYGNKRHTTWLGYKVHLTETCDQNRVHLITNVQTTEAHSLRCRPNRINSHLFSQQRFTTISAHS